MTEERIRKDACPGCREPKDIRALLCRFCRTRTFNSGSGRVCCVCKEEKTFDAFRFRGDGKHRDGRKTPRPRSTCIECERAKMRQLAAARRAKTPQAVKAYKAKWARSNPKSVRRMSIRQFCKRQGWSPETTASVLQRHATVLCCEICDRTPEEVGSNRFKRLSIDHCHATNQFRGLLCWECNIALGKFGDDPERLRRAIEYLGRSGVAQEAQAAVPA